MQDPQKQTLPIHLFELQSASVDIKDRVYSIRSNGLSTSRMPPAVCGAIDRCLTRTRRDSTTYLEYKRGGLALDYGLETRNTLRRARFVWPLFTMFPAKIRSREDQADRTTPPNSHSPTSLMCQTQDPYLNGGRSRV